MSELVEVASYPNAIEANLAKAYLESEGVESVLFDEGTNSVFGMPYGIGEIPVRLMVLDKDLNEARRVLRDCKS